MLRTIRISAPAESLGELVAAAREGRWDIKDYCVDSNPDARWPWAGDGRAAILLVVEDEHHSPEETFEAFTQAWTSLAQDPSVLALGESHVFWPEGCVPELYVHLDGPTCELHALEARIRAGEASEVEKARALEVRSDLSVVLAHAFEQGEAAWEDFAASMAAKGITPTNLHQ